MLRDSLIRLTSLLLLLYAGTAFAAAPVYECGSTSNTNVTGAAGTAAIGGAACVTSGDWLWTCIAAYPGTGTQTLTAPSGFTIPTNGTNINGNNVLSACAYKVPASGSEGALTWTLNGSGAGYWAGFVADYRGGTNTLDGVQSNNQGSVTTITSPAITTTLNADTLISVFTTSGSSVTMGGAPGDETLRWSTGGGASTSATVGADKTIATPSSVASETNTPSGNTAAVSLTIAFGGTTPTSSGFIYVP